MLQWATISVIEIFPCLPSNRGRISNFHDSFRKKLIFYHLNLYCIKKGKKGKRTGSSKRANLAFEKLLMDRFFAAVCTWREKRERIWSKFISQSDYLFGDCFLSRNQDTIGNLRLAGFCFPSYFKQSSNVNVGVRTTVLQCQDEKYAYHLAYDYIVLPLRLWRLHPVEKSRYKRKPSCVVVSERKIRSQFCLRLHCNPFTALVTASCREIKIEKETFLGTDNFVLSYFLTVRQDRGVYELLIAWREVKRISNLTATSK